MKPATAVLTVHTNDLVPSIAPAPGRPDRQVELGFMFDHSLISDASRQAIGAASAAFALTDLLVEKGFLQESDVKAHRDRIEAKLMKQAEESGLGLFLSNAPEDKYALSQLPEINCADRMHLCKAACCLLRFPLSRQDVEEGKIRWDLGRPYWNLRAQTGYCVHNDPENHCCTQYAARPGTCRAFDCRGDQRIWLDFEAMKINPNLEAALATQPETNDAQRLS
jgi:Fe-S-cluster containining protein